ncbi:MAG: diguanylate cyclase [Colwellia sp.]|nr:diguanylate cyclase [Colwellia sp.]
MNIKKQYNILAVDDAKDTLMLLEFDLAEEGYQVFTADCGEVALKILAEQNIDLILLDMYMPGISGLAMLQKLKAHPVLANISVIMLSASDDEDQIVAALEFGADDYVTKPYIPKVLLARLRTSLRLLEKTLELESLAKTDFLTGINNRGCFDDLAHKAVSLAKRNELPIVIAMLDIDFFKAVNDNYGHDAGDKVLIKFAEVMSECFRDYDIIGRVGGEEFSVCMPNTSAENATIACDRFRERLENTQILLTDSQAESITVTVSIGLSLGQGAEISLDDLLKKSDISLYQAKESGRNQVKLYSDEVVAIDESALSVDKKSSSEKYPGIDYQIGVGNVLGDDSLFAEILVMFYEDHAQDKDKIQQAIATDDQDSCKHLVHTLKGVACSVGAMTLFEYAKALDVAINLAEKESYQALFNPTSLELTKIMSGIEEELADKL